MIVPAHRNSNALNKAWVSRWKSAKVLSPKPSLIIISPSCLRVDRAMIFFRSVSRQATVPAMNLVIIPVMSSLLPNHLVKESVG